MKKNKLYKMIRYIGCATYVKSNNRLNFLDKIKYNEIIFLLEEPSQQILEYKNVGTDLVVAQALVKNMVVFVYCGGNNIKFNDIWKEV